MADRSGRRDVASLVTPPEHAPGDVPLLVGDRYRVLDVLGRGGAATVYRAHDLMLGREVAVKVLAPVEPSCDEVRRHEAEMRVLSSLRHPGLVTLYDAGTDAVDRGALVRAYLVMELVAGPTLARRLDDGALDARRTARVGWALAGALATVHARGVVHRDVKPGNVLLTAGDALDGDARGVPEHAPVKLADFGIARIAAATRLTMTGAIVGTATYLSPEQATGSALGPATDVYALGLVLLECLTGVPVFVGTVAEVATARLSRDPAVPAGVEPALAGLLRRMTTRNPEARPTAAEVRDELADWLDRDPATFPSALGVLPAPTVPVPTVPVETVPAPTVAAATVPVGTVPVGTVPVGTVPAPRAAVDEPRRPEEQPTTVLTAVDAPRRSRGASSGWRHRAVAVAATLALLLGGAAATGAVVRAHAEASAAAASERARAEDLRDDVAAVTAALGAGRLDAADAMLERARAELAAARRSGALPEARLTAFAATLDGAAAQLATARTVQAQAEEAARVQAEQAQAEQAQAELAATTEGPAAERPAPGPGKPNGKGGPGPGKGKGKG